MGTFVFGFLLFAFASYSSAEPELVKAPDAASGVQEFRLQGYQVKSLLADLPIVDLHLASNQRVWLLGKRSLWRWDIPTGDLAQIHLFSAADSLVDETLETLGSDGVSLFAASEHSLFQIQGQGTKVTYFANPQRQPGRSLSFAGWGDNTWLLHTGGLYYVDPFGKKLVARFQRTGLEAGDRTFFDSQSKQLYIGRKNKIYRREFSQHGELFKTVFETDDKILDLQATIKGFVAITCQKVIFFGLDGLPRQTVPVVAGRLLTAVAISGEIHAYLFADTLLEVIDMQSHRISNYRLPLSRGMIVDKLTLQGDLVALTISGKPKVFSLMSLQNDIPYAPKDFP